MDQRIQEVLSEYEARAAKESPHIMQMPEDEWRRRRDEFMLSVGHDTGRLLNILAKGAGARRILELGSSYGYSTLWLAEAARKTGGTVFSLEMNSPKQEYAHATIAKAGLAEYVKFFLGDALETLTSLEGPFDFVLLDLWKDVYVSCFDLFYPKLNPGAIVVADNMLRPEDYLPDALKYRRHVRSHPKIDSVLLPVGSGIELSRYGGDLAKS
ncbi:MAG TPA: O-methyltransferase [Candidatus Acidoferrales bacterium]